MPLFASGVGAYGSVGGLQGKNMLARPAAGNSNMMPAKTVSSEVSLARQSTQNFIDNGRMVNKGASGKSRINVKA